MSRNDFFSTTLCRDLSDLLLDLNLLESLGQSLLLLLHLELA
jgi:hypothetical protein